MISQEPLRYRWRWLLAAGLCGVSWLWGAPSRAIARPQCETELSIIVPQLLADLPSYGNRVIQRSRRLDRAVDSYSYIVIASPAEFQPLSLQNRQFTPTMPDTTAQVFFTTRETQYSDRRKITFEHYYWLLLTPTKKGWAIAHMLSSIANPDPFQLANPPRDVLGGGVAEGARLWLRDYYFDCGDVFHTAES